ncbi:hypothetical protein J3R03_008598 [Actinoplanes couchii]|nr:hypothetical protein [Actinoplanes couchii]
MLLRRPPVEVIRCFIFLITAQPPLIRARILCSRSARNSGSPNQSTHTPRAGSRTSRIRCPCRAASSHPRTPRPGAHSQNPRRTPALPFGDQLIPPREPQLKRLRPASIAGPERSKAAKISQTVQRQQSKPIRKGQLGGRHPDRRQPDGWVELVTPPEKAKAGRDEPGRRGPCGHRSARARESEAEPDGKPGRDWYSATRCHTVRRRAAPRRVAWRGVARCGVARCGVARCGVAWRGAVRRGVVRRGVVRCGVVRRGVVRRTLAPPKQGGARASASV